MAKKRKRFNASSNLLWRGSKQQSGNFYSTFDRNEFYKINIGSIVRFVDKNIKVNMRGNFSEYDGKQGVWAVYSGRKCLDVCETSNIGFEMRQWELMYYESKGRTDKEIKRLNKLFNYNRSKKRDIAKNHSTFSFRVISYQSDKTRREKIELQYAHKHKAKYWSPAPGNQQRLAHKLFTKKSDKSMSELKKEKKVRQETALKKASKP